MNKDISHWTWSHFLLNPTIIITQNWLRWYFHLTMSSVLLNEKNMTTPHTTSCSDHTRFPLHTAQLNVCMYNIPLHFSNLTNRRKKKFIYLFKLFSCLSIVHATPTLQILNWVLEFTDWVKVESTGSCKWTCIFHSNSTLFIMHLQCYSHSYARYSVLILIKTTFHCQFMSLLIYMWSSILLFDA